MRDRGVDHDPPTDWVLGWRDPAAECHRQQASAVADCHDRGPGFVGPAQPVDLSADIPGGRRIVEAIRPHHDRAADPGRVG
jgi:hypothetical protein